MRILSLNIFIFLLSFLSPELAVAEKRAANGEDNTAYSIKLPDTVIIDSIAVHKGEHRLQVFSRQQLVKTYKVQLGLNPVGRKQCSGDCKTPEGLYYIEMKNWNSLFHKSLKISYPNPNDLANARRLGKSAGGDIMIHGLPNSEANAGMDRFQNDWTWGCIAVRNEEIDELFSKINTGVPILILP